MRSHASSLWYYCSTLCDDAGSLSECADLARAHAVQAACPDCNMGLSWVRSLSDAAIDQIHRSEQVRFRLLTRRWQTPLQPRTHRQQLSVHPNMSQVLQEESGRAGSKWQWLPAPDAACGVAGEGGHTAAAVAASSEPAEAGQDGNGSRASAAGKAPLDAARIAIGSGGVCGPSETHSAASGDSVETHVCSDRTAFPPCRGHAAHLSETEAHTGRLLTEQDSQQCPTDDAAVARQTATGLVLRFGEAATARATTVGAHPLATAAAIEPPSAPPHDGWHLHVAVKVPVLRPLG